MKGRKKGDVGEAECGEEGMLNEDSRLGRELAGLEGKRGWKRGKWGGRGRGGGEVGLVAEGSDRGKQAGQEKGEASSSSNVG